MKKEHYRRWIGYTMLFLVSTNIVAQDSTRYAIIPRPVKLKAEKGYFGISKKTVVELCSDDRELKKAGDYLIARIAGIEGIHLQYGRGKQRDRIVFSLDSNMMNVEGYRLAVSEQEIVISARRPQGAFLAVQTLRQLLPVDTKGDGEIRVPAVRIEDEPRFSHRGLMLDVGRYYFPVDFLKKYIDALAFYKINTFHLHLTEDAGWRMEIRKYPRLQEVAAWRDSTVVGHVKDVPEKFDGKRHGGYYTQEELKDLVQYANDRFITIIPEIDMPGHTLAALAAYPELSCRPDTTYQVLTRWGIQKDIMCPNEFTFKFLEDVLTEVMEVFPGKYIHIGGDEAPKDRWKESAYCQELIRKLGLKDEHELQSYFIQRIERFVNSKGRAIIGWDEILEGGLAPNATVMSWRGEKGGIAAAREHHRVIMSPNTHLYFDYYQTKAGRKDEPVAIGGYLPLEKVYSYDPVPAGLSAEEAACIAGPQGNVWTEYISEGSHAEHMTFPRACALAEVGWTSLAEKDYDDFISRLKRNVVWLDKMGVNYARYFLRGKEW